MTRRVGVVGAGYVGLTTAVCLAERGIDTVCVDIDAQRIARLRSGSCDLDEPVLPGLLDRAVSTRRLRFHADLATLADREVVFVCVPTPSGPDGAADISAVESVVTALAAVLDDGAVIAVKSTVPVGTSRHLAQHLTGHGVRLVSSPEFLRESHAVEDFRRPDRVVIGATDPGAAELVGRVLDPTGAVTQTMTVESAELAKYASNAFLAVKLSYANSLAHLCARAGADIGDVTRAMGSDSRIGMEFLRPGPGWGGSCLPKDTAALVHTARMYGVGIPEVSAARTTNAGQSDRIRAAVEGALERSISCARIAALGLAFKAGTADLRDSPALTICTQLAATGAQVVAYDPRLAVMDERAIDHHHVVAVDDPYRAVKAVDVIVVLTEWPQFRELDWAVVGRVAARAVVLDTRNTLCRATVEGAGLRYIGNGTIGGY